MIRREIIERTVFMATWTSAGAALLLYFSRHFYFLAFSERLWLLLGGDIAGGGYIQFVLFFCGYLNYFLLRDRKEFLESQRAGFQYFDKILRPSSTNSQVFLKSDIGNLRGRILKERGLDDFVLTQIIMRVCSKFRATHSVSETLDILSSQIESWQVKDFSDCAHIRSINWAIPSIGFIGTIIGMAGALKLAGSNNVSAISSSLGVAFDTTLVALVINIVLTVYYNYLQSEFDNFYVHVKDYVTDNIVNNIETRDDEKKISA